MTQPYLLFSINAQLTAKKESRAQRKQIEKNLAISIFSDAPPHLQKAIELAQKKGASNWLSTLPLKEYMVSRYTREPFMTPASRMNDLSRILLLTVLVVPPSLWIMSCPVQRVVSLY